MNMAMITLSDTVLLASFLLLVALYLYLCFKSKRTAERVLYIFKLVEEEALKHQEFRKDLRENLRGYLEELHEVAGRLDRYMKERGI